MNLTSQSPLLGHSKKKGRILGWGFEIFEGEIEF